MVSLTPQTHKLSLVWKQLARQSPNTNFHEQNAEQNHQELGLQTHVTAQQHTAEDDENARNSQQNINTASYIPFQFLLLKLLVTTSQAYQIIKINGKLSRY